MGLGKEERGQRVIRAIKTVFFLITLLISFLFFSAPVLLALADTILPSALLSASLSSSSSSSSYSTSPAYAFQSQSPLLLTPNSLSSHFANYDFRYSLIDIPLLSILRSLVIICVYSCCDGPRLSRGPYLWVATICSVVSLVFVSLKAPFVFGGSSAYNREGHAKFTEVALFVCSVALAVGHVFVAYRTSCRERKKLLVYKIDIEAVNSACKKVFPRYEKMLQEERKK